MLAPLRLINVHSYQISQFDHRIPSYACASHCYQAAGETSYRAFQLGRDRTSSGYRKVIDCASYIAQHHTAINWLWIDTVCIDKENSQEVCDAANDMFDIVRSATVCIVWLQDISISKHNALISSKWFTRAWTLLELLAARLIVFLDHDWRIYGHKAPVALPHFGPYKVDEIANALSIPRECVQNYDRQHYSEVEIWKWSKARKATVSEDRVYCLLGLLGVRMDISYGEGYETAERRLLEKLRPTQRSSAFRPHTLVSNLTPSHRTANFSGRAGLLAELAQKAQAGSRTALWGLGGIGKSQLAIEYAHRISQAHQRSSMIFWLAKDASTFDKMVKQTVRRTHYDQQDKRSHFELLQDWLRTQQEPWLIVLDNLDDGRYLLEPPEGHPMPRIAYIPDVPHGRLLITTRDRNIARKLVDEANIISVTNMEPSEALQMLVATVGEVADCNLGRLIVERLDYIPLAIASAGAYLRSIIPSEERLQAYANALQPRTSSRLVELKRNERLPDRAWQASNSVLTNYQQAIQAVSAQRESAPRLLHLMSFCDIHSIPTFLLTGAQQRYSDENQRAFVDDSAMLVAWSLISPEKGTTTWSLTPMVRDAIQDLLQQASQKHKPQEALVKCLHQHFSAAEQAQDSTRLSILLPHALATLSFDLVDDNAKEAWASLLGSVAILLMSSGDSNQALQAAATSHKVRVEALGMTHKDTLDAGLVLAQVHRAKGDWSAAITLLEAMTGASKECIATGVTSTMAHEAVLELAGTYAASQAWAQARVVLDVAIKACEALPEPNQADLLALKTQLASVQMGAGEWRDADVLHREILHLKQTSAPDDELEIMLSKGDLAVVLKKQAQLKEAEELEKEVLEARQRLMGPEHRYTLVAMANLATTLRMQKRYEESKELGELALAVAKQAYGSEDPMTLTSMNDLAITLSRLERWKDAEAVQAEVLELSARVYGADQLRTITAKANLAVTYRNTSRFDQAAEFEETVLRARTDRIGSEHPDTMRAMYNLAMTNSKRGQLGVAKTMLRSVIEKRTRKHGPEHPETKEAVDALKQMELEGSVPRSRWIYNGTGSGGDEGFSHLGQYKMTVLFVALLLYHLYTVYL